MNGTLDCIPCLVRQAVGLSKIVFTEDKERQAWINETLIDLSKKDFLNCTPPDVTQEFFKDLLKKGDLADPYKDTKVYYNQEILKLEPALNKRIAAAKDSLTEALALAIAGNIIDFGTPGGVSREQVDKTLKMVEDDGLTKDDSQELFQDFGQLKNLLYLGDNCGEIVFDKLFIKEIQKQYPDLSITFVVRGSPILNDITLDDASDTGLDKIVRVISNGDSAPGTRLKHCSSEFLQAYKEADFVIAKGQGNLETLDVINDKKIYFLFMTKCQLISEMIGVPLHSLMCMRNNYDLTSVDCVPTDY